jgi:hypothetical protein
MEVINGISCTILAVTNMIGEAIRARGMAAVRGAMAAVVVGGTGAAITINAKLESLHKQCKLAI